MKSERIVYVDKRELLEKTIKADNERRMAVVDSDFIALVNDATEINDVAPVVHGEWIYYSHTMQECTVCKRHTARHRYEFCPHCGAKMDGGEK